MKKGTILRLVHQLQNHDLEKPLELQVTVKLPSQCPHCGNKDLHRHGVMPRRRGLDPL